MTKNELIHKVKNKIPIPDLIPDYKTDNNYNNVPVLFCKTIIIKGKRKIETNCPFCDSKHIHKAYDIGDFKKGRPIYYFGNCYSSDSPFYVSGYFLVEKESYYKFMEQKQKQRELPKNIHQLSKIMNIYTYDVNKIQLDIDAAFVYFIVHENEIVYIGKSKDIVNRFKNHHILKGYPYDSIYYIKVRFDNMFIIEKELINRINPIHNDSNKIKRKFEFGFKY